MKGLKEQSDAQNVIALVSRIPPFGRLGQEDLECQVTQDCLAKPCLKKQADNVHACQDPAEPQALTMLQRGLAWRRVGPRGSQLGQACIQMAAWPRSLKASEKEPKAVGRGRTSRGNLSINSLPSEGMPTAYQLVHMSIGPLSSSLSGSCCKTCRWDCGQEVGRELCTKLLSVQCGISL